MFTGELLSALNEMLAGKETRPVRKAVSRKLSTKLEHPELGEIQLVVSRRAKRITLTVKPDCSVRLSIPYGMPVESGLKFLELKKKWAIKTIDKYRSRTPVILPPYNTRRHELVMGKSLSDKVTVRISDGRITVACPAGISAESEIIQQAIRKGLCEAMRAEAKEHLPERLAVLSNQTGLKYRKVAVRNTVSKWGSCSVQNDISLSLHLMRLPDYLIDYVLVHELCHTVHKNHGPKFHELLDKLTCGRHTELRTELRDYHTRW